MGEKEEEIDKLVHSVLMTNFEEKIELDKSRPRSLSYSLRFSRSNYPSLKKRTCLLI